MEQVAINFDNQPAIDRFVQVITYADTFGEDVGVLSLTADQATLYLGRREMAACGFNAPLSVDITSTEGGGISLIRPGSESSPHIMAGCGEELVMVNLVRAWFQDFHDGDYTIKGISAFMNRVMFRSYHIHEINHSDVTSIPGLHLKKCGHIFKRAHGGVTLCLDENDMSKPLASIKVNQKQIKISQAYMNALESSHPDKNVNRVVGVIANHSAQTPGGLFMRQRREFAQFLSACINGSINQDDFFEKRDFDEARIAFDEVKISEEGHMKPFKRISKTPDAERTQENIGGAVTEDDDVATEEAAVKENPITKEVRAAWKAFKESLKPGLAKDISEAGKFVAMEDGTFYVKLTDLYSRHCRRYHQWLRAAMRKNFENIAAMIHIIEKVEPGFNPDGTVMMDSLYINITDEVYIYFSPESNVSVGEKVWISLDPKHGLVIRKTPMIERKCIDRKVMSITDGSKYVRIQHQNKPKNLAAANFVGLIGSCSMVLDVEINHPVTGLLALASMDDIHATPQEEPRRNVAGQRTGSHAPKFRKPVVIDAAVEDPIVEILIGMTEIKPAVAEEVGVAPVAEPVTVIPPDAAPEEVPVAMVAPTAAPVSEKPAAAKPVATRRPFGRKKATEEKVAPAETKPAEAVPGEAALPEWAAKKLQKVADRMEVPLEVLVKAIERTGTSVEDYATDIVADELGIKKPRM